MAELDPRCIHKKIPKAEDVEIHISTVSVAGTEFTDIREYIPSLDEYGRGITFPLRLNSEVLAGLSVVEGMSAESEVANAS